MPRPFRLRHFFDRRFFVRGACRRKAGAHGASAAFGTACDVLRGVIGDDRTFSDAELGELSTPSYAVGAQIAFSSELRSNPVWFGPRSKR